MFSIISAIFMARLTLLGCRLFHRAGTSLPGDVALTYCPDILTHLSKDVFCILVTGTNGKTTTVAMIRTILANRQIPVIANKEGANMQSGMIVPFLWHCTPWGSSFRKIAVLECDEKWVPLALKEVHPKVVVITNLSEDQTDRTESPDSVYQILLNGIKASDAALCINKSCPISSRMTAEKLPNQIISFSAEGKTVSVNGTFYPVSLPIPGDYNIENAAAAAAACLFLDIPCEESISALKSCRAPFGRMESFSLDGVPVTICLTKNVVSADRILSYIKSTAPDAQVVFGFHNKPGDSIDCTWIRKIGISPDMHFLWDAIVSGTCAGEIHESLADSGFSCRKAITPNDVFSLIRNSSRPVFILASYNYMMEIRHLFSKKGYLKDFWKM